MEIVIIGAGKLAWHLAKALFEQEHRVSTIYNRTLRNAFALAGHVDAKATDQLAELPQEADLYILAVADAAIEEVAQQMSTHGFDRVVHTSGATTSALLQPYFSHYGCFYPLMSFSKQKAVDFQKIPLCIYGNQKSFEVQLQTLASQLSQEVHRLDDQQRAQLHMGAVFANNFVNHCYQISHQILKDAQIDPIILNPIIQETAKKILAAPPAEMQTGPAVREDWPTIERHQALLKDYPKYQELYNLMTKLIVDSKNT